MPVQPHENFTPRYRNYVLAILTIGYLFNYVDRQVMTILLEPIKNEFGVTDTHMGFLSGLATVVIGATLYWRGSRHYVAQIQHRAS